MLGAPVDGECAAVDQDDDQGLADGVGCLEQVDLRFRQVDVRAIALAPAFGPQAVPPMITILFFLFISIPPGSQG